MIVDINLEKCNGCGKCVECCPLDTLRLDTFGDEAPPCQFKCPAGVDIKSVHYLLKQRKLEEAHRLLREFLPYPSITGRLCHKPCESVCVRKAVDEEVGIRDLECFVSDYASNFKSGPVPVIHAAKIAILGAGPLGLAIAYFLKRYGFSVTVFENQPHLGRAFRNYDEATLPAELIDNQIQYIKDIGVTFHTGVDIGGELTLKDLSENYYGAVCLSEKEFWHESRLLNGASCEQDLAPLHDSFETNIPGIFACRSHSEEDELINTVAIAREAANKINSYLTADFATVKHSNPEKKRVTKFSTKSTSPQPKQSVPNIFGKDISVGDFEELARSEASRCMTCGSRAYIYDPDDCMTCFECELLCPTGAIDVHPFKENLPLTVPKDSSK